PGVVVNGAVVETDSPVGVKALAENVDAGFGVVVGDGVGDSHISITTGAIPSADSDSGVAKPADVHVADVNVRELGVVGTVSKKLDAVHLVYGRARADDVQVGDIETAGVVA